MLEAKATYCGRCGHTHVKGTPCPRPFKEGLKNPKDNPCWRGYHPVGTKMKDGHEVPNCVPINENETNLIDKIRQHAEFDIKGRDNKRAAIANKYLKDLEKLSTWEEMSKYATDMGLDAVRKGQYTKAAMFNSLSKVLNVNKPVEEMHTLNHDGSTEHHQVHADAEEGLEINEYCPNCLAEYITECWNNDFLEEAKYHGRTVKLGKPFLTPGGPKKRSVYVKNAKGNVVKVNFGDPNMRIKKSNPKRRKSYRARHHCENPGPRWKANYWSCRAW